MPSRSPVQLIDEDLNALRALRKIAQNEAALQSMKRILRECFSANGNGQLGPKEDATPPRRGAIWPTGIQKNTEKLLPLLQGKDFDYSDVISTLGQNGYAIASKNPRSAIGWVLRHLVKKGKLRLVKKGIAGSPSIYRLL